MKYSHGEDFVVVVAAAAAETGVNVEIEIFALVIVDGIGTEFLVGVGPRRQHLAENNVETYSWESTS